MSQGGTIKSRLEALDKKLNAESELWKEKGLTYEAYRMGNQEIYMQAHINAMVRIFKEHLNISEDELNIIYKEEVLKMVEKLRPDVFRMAEEARREALRQQLTQGIHMKPPKNENGEG